MSYSLLEVQVVIPMLWSYLDTCWSLPSSHNLTHTYTCFSKQYCPNSKWRFFFISIRSKQHVHEWLHILTYLLSGANCHAVILSSFQTLFLLFSLSVPVMVQLHSLLQLLQSVLTVLFILEIWKIIPILKFALLFGIRNKLIVAWAHMRKMEIGVL